MSGKTYAGSGVDIEKGDRFAQFIASLPSKAVSKSLGGFAGGVEIDTNLYKRPVMLTTTDGVGTKLLVAQKLGIFDTVGIDLVAMCVNDLVVCGAAPQVFLDYMAIGKIDEPKLQAIIKGIVEGCEQAECILAGGETAEMPDVYHGDDFDLAGFAVGLVDKDNILPRLEEMKAGDVLLGLPSLGVHSNGFSLARKCISETETEIWKELLTPTKIYVKEMKYLLTLKGILGAAHITGGGLEGNLERVVPKKLKMELNWSWPVPSIFDAIQKGGNVSEAEMRKVFNLGIGMALVVSQSEKDDFIKLATQAGITLLEMGRLMNG